MELKSPVKKHYRAPPFVAPLPICNETTDTIYLGEYEWPTFTGKFTGTAVIVDEPRDIISLSKKGFFGKGSLSRGAPAVCKRKPPIRVISESQWKRRKEWSEKFNMTLEDYKARQDLCEEKPADTFSETPVAGSCSRPADSQNEQNKTESDVSIQIEDVTTKSNIAEVELTSSEYIVGENVVEAKSDVGNSSTRESQSEPTVSEPSYSKSEIEGKTEELGVSNSDEPTSTDDVEKTNATEEEKKNEQNSLKSSESKSESATETPLEITTSLNQDTKPLDDDEVLVISDLGTNLDEALSNLNPHIEKESPKTVFEVLYLTLEEAFFLSYALDCLQVLDLTGKYLSNKELWMLFKEAQEDFIEKYVAYHNFRSKGWVVKCGLKYGGDFLLYKKGPLYFHASCIVLVKTLKPDGSPVNGRSSFTWEKMLTLNRMSENATKEILVCEVMRPDKPDESFDNPIILKEFKVGELLLRRWQCCPNAEKEKEKEGPNSSP